MSNPNDFITRTHIIKPKVNVSLFWGLVGVIYVAFAALLFFRSDGFFYLMNFFPRVLPYFAATPDPSEFFTVIFASGFLLSQGFIAFGISLRPRDHVLPTILLLSKAAVIAAFTYSFLNQQKTFAFLIGGVTESAVALALAFRFIKIPLRKKHP